ncbi:alcohol dehydrogenase catalytic domain-containing protein [Plantactinospora sp. KLBMP9567]|uniref:alcohol dehydrogenase catalytic domain-containing protein n=1 Tax=Plantactinospora sp. KLBMP9567 TaxID=3085900 RepID=UPI0029821DA6|nr:alcohol dehydrogenase catalytic domain-containing protein [Plantactinospora sp. KLBMP9567]MDW5330203.1 alcohol dehydrogenase catalytic domain-containing protein [Plantactinospora sp. KLBMP9567]
MSQMKAAVIAEANAAWVLEDRPVPEVGPNDVLVRIRACGICGTDVWMANGTLSFHEFPLILGHEGVGEVVAVGEGVTKRRVGDRVGIPMAQRTCGVCDFCREEHPVSFVSGVNCANPTLTGVTVDGAFAEYIAADADGTVLLPDGISYEDAAPTLCAGYTVWAALRKVDPKPGAKVAVVGVGGLGHFAIQYAKAAGYHVTAVTRTGDKQELARRLGADNVVADGAALKEAGGADVLMHTSSSHAAIVDAMNGLKPWGKVVMMGVATDELPLPAGPLTFQGYEVIGSAHNGMEYLVEALDFVARGAVKPMVEVFSKERVGEAYEAASSGKVRFKAVVTF